MTADEIRAVKLEIVTRQTDEGPLQFAVDLNARKFEMLREIATQLAEFNERESRNVEETYRYLVAGKWKP